MNHKSQWNSNFIDYIKSIPLYIKIVLLEVTGPLKLLNKTSGELTYSLSQVNVGYFFILRKTK